MCRIANLVTEAERKYVRRFGRFQQHREASCYHFFLQGKAPKEMHAILTEALGEHAPSYATVKNWVALLVIFLPVMRLVLNDPKQ